ncbi:MAG TPA: dihydrolipoamide acetyltransferase family protein [Rubrobacteraceae bacterium]|nr:dihydrolipoamide acetyltransferase family protein [Rubrobacteraceae bacterium]
MAKPVTMPQLGESVTEGTIARWLKAEGDEVEKDEPLCEVDTDKVSAELPSPMAGTLEEILISEGTTVDVGTEIARMAVAGEQDGSPDGEAPQREDASAEAPTEEFPVAETEAQPVATAGVSHSAATRTSGNGDGKVESAETLRQTRSSPVVRRLAAEHDLDIQEIPGTGIEGRVTKKDIERYIKEREATPEPLPEAEPTEPERVEVYEGDRVEELTSARRTIANRMSASKREAPHAWTMVEVDVTGLVGLRDRAKREFAEREGLRLTYLPFIVKAAVEGLKEYPVLNSVWDGDRIVLRKRVNVGIAVDLEDVLIVPVLRDADELNVLGLARKINELVEKARNSSLAPDDVSGGTFTVNNPGALGSVVSTPIINHPQAAILSAEAIAKRPVVVDAAIAIRSMMNLEVSFDHRIFDGGTALRYLNAVKRRLEGYTPNDRLE